jgi:pseudaminic acid cytidylyltransferase
LNLAVIPARGGSKRIPRKNVKPFCGKPMIAYSIEAAQATGVFDRIIVSTDDDEIADVAQRFGAEVPFRRSADLANDYTPTLPVVADTIRQLGKAADIAEYVCCIYATAPFLKSHFLREGFELLRSHADADFTFAVTSYTSPIFRALRRDEDGRIQMFWPENELTRSQDLPPAWHDAGQFYWGRRQAFLSQEGVFSARSYGVVLPRHLVQDIDTPEDWLSAERIFRTQ